MVLGFSMVIIGGYLLGKLFKALGLPALLGALVFGVVVGPSVWGLIPEAILEAGPELRMIALTIILLRAGLGLNKDLLLEVGWTAFRMSFIPCILEGVLATLAAYYLLQLPFTQAGLLGFTLAAVSPAVIVPSMLALKESGLGMKRGVPVIVLAGAALDDAVAITFFSAFLGLAVTGGTVVGWGIPLRVVWAIVGGGLLGLIAYLIYKVLFSLLSPTPGEETVLILGMAFAVMVAGDMVAASGPLAAMTLGFILLERMPRSASRMDGRLADLWAGAQLFLFVLIGAAVQLPVMRQAGLLGLAVILIGLCGRTTGVFTALIGSPLNLKERSFAAIAYSPKATVQAAIGGIPLALGLPGGEIILSVAVLSIVFTAPLGALAIARSAPLLLEKINATATIGDP